MDWLLVVLLLAALGAFVLEIIMFLHYALSRHPKAADFMLKLLVAMVVTALVAGWLGTKLP